MKHPLELLFYIAFASQIYLLSYEIPRRISARRWKVLENFPPEKYPKLYTQSRDQYLISDARYRMLNTIILLIGIVVFLSLVFVVDHSTFADDGYVSEAWPAGYGMLQFVPLIFLEIAQFRELRAMREANTATSRQAELKPRRLFDFLSPTLFLIALILFLSVLATDLVIGDGMSLSILTVAVTLILASLGWWNLRGRNLNPHQANADRSTQISATLTSFAYVSIIMSIFYLFTLADQVYDIDYLDAFTLSVYFQLVAGMSTGFLLQCMRLEDMDFDVYKDNSVVS